jgi:hypothetical protein
MFSFIFNVLSFVVALVTTTKPANSISQFQGKRSPLDPDLSTSMQRLVALTITKFLCCCVRRKRSAVTPIQRSWTDVILVPTALTTFDLNTKQLVTPISSDAEVRSAREAKTESQDAATLTTGMHALLFPCVLSAVTDLAFPFDLLGSVHESSVIRVLSVAGLRQVLQNGLPCDVDVQWDPATDVTPHKRGSVCTFTTRLYSKLSSSSASASRTILWESQKRMLFFHKQNASIAADVTKQDVAALPAVLSLSLPGDLGWSWARISRDYNPIHV